MTLGKKTFAGSLALVGLTLLVAGTALAILRTTQNAYQGFIDVDQRVLLQLEGLRIASLKQTEGFRGFLLYGDEPHLQPWNEGVAELRTHLEELRRLLGAPVDREVLAEIERLEGESITMQMRAIELRRRGRVTEAVTLAEELAVPVRQQILEKLPPFVARKEQGLAESRRALAAQVHQANTAMVVLSVFAAVFGVGFAFLFTRTTTRELREAVSQLTSAGAEILATTTQAASSAAETASAVNETSTTVEEVKQTAHLSAQKAKAVSEGAQKASQVSQRGKGSAAGAVEGMDQIRQRMEFVAEGVVRLSEQSQAISEIIAAVSDLADQSNLLAVNAAIEAAKAGEQGKGFAVVAQEVRSLAEQSKQATAQVRSILGDIQKATSASVLAAEQATKAVESGVRLSADTGEAIQSLAETITEAAQAATQIAASSQQQLVGMEQVAGAMENIRQATNQNVAGTKQAEQAAQNLSLLGGRLRKLIEKVPA